MATKSYVCGYKHCQIHEKVLESNAVIVGKRRYHKECAELRNKINQLKELYLDNIDPNTPMVELLGVINRIIFTNHTDIDYMLYAVTDLIQRKVKIKSPYTLYYIADNKQKYSRWKQKQQQNKECGE